MNKFKIHGIIISVLLLVVLSTWMNVRAAEKEGDPTGVLSWLPVMLVIAIYCGIVFVLYLLPNIASSAATSVLSSNARVDDDPLRDARAAHARGDYEDAIKSYQKAIDNADIETSEPDRLPWVEIAKIQHDILHDPYASVQTLQKALTSQEWSPNDSGYFMTRMAEIYSEDLANKEQSRKIFEQIIEKLPDSRFSANAAHKLRILSA